MADPTQPGPAPPDDNSNGETTRTFAGQDAVAGRRESGGSPKPTGRAPIEEVLHEPPTRAARPRPPAAAQPGQSAEAARPGPSAEAVQLEPPAEIVSYGPGVPGPRSGSQARQKAEYVWRGGDRPARARRRQRLPRLLSSVLTVILLAASGVVLYLRFHHSQPLHVTGVAISDRTPVACGVDLTGRIATNGAVGTVSYQWLVQPRRRQPRPRTRVVAAGQHSVPVHLVVSASGHGTTSKLVTLQVLAPDPRTASVNVAITC